MHATAPRCLREAVSSHRDIVTRPGARAQALAARIPVIDPFVVPIPMVSVLLLLAFWLAGVVLPRFASGQIVIDDPPRNVVRWPEPSIAPPPDFLFQPAAIETHAELTGQIARVTVEQHYENH